MKKLLSIIMSIIALFGACSFVGCGSNLVKDDKTINIALNKAGYGVAWMERIIEKFESLYEDEGYKVNLLPPSAEYKAPGVLTEMRNYTAGDCADLYFVEGMYVKDAIDPTYGVCVESLNDVFNAGAINFDGSIEETKIKDLPSSSMYRYLNTDMDNQDEYYSFLYYASPTGLVCNTKVLNDYGYTELPRTTDQLFAIYDGIYKGTNGKAGSKESGVYPVTWAGDNAYGYSYAAFMNQFASMLGHKGFEDFFTLDYTKEDIYNGYNAYKDVERELTATLKDFIHTYDVMYSYVGSPTQRHDAAHAQLITGKAAFMSDGSYFFNECKANFGDKLGDVRFFPIPMISELGVMLKLDGSGSDRKKCDEILSYLCDCFDSGMNQAQMKDAASEKFPSVTFTDKQIQRIWEARGTVVQNLQGHAYIIKNSKVKDIAVLFLRMLASKDAAKLMFESCMPNAYNPVRETSSKYAFINDVAIHSSQINKSVFLSLQYGVREELRIDMLGFTTSLLCAEVTGAIGVEKDVSLRDYDKWAKYFYDKIYKNVEKNWVDRAKNAGY